MGAGAWEGWLLGGAPSFTFLFTQCWLWLCQGPRPASARSQPTRLWWPDSGPYSPACYSTTQGSCNGPRTGWHWAWVRDSKVSGAVPLAQHPDYPVFAHTPPPTHPQIDSLTQYLLVVHLSISFLCSSLSSPVCVSQAFYLSS